MKSYRGRRGIAPLILNLCTRCTWVVKQHAPAAFPPGKSHGTHWTEGCVSMVLEKRTISYSCRESSPGQSSPYPSPYTEYVNPVSRWANTYRHATAWPRRWRKYDPLNHCIYLPVDTPLHTGRLGCLGVVSFRIRPIYKGWKCHRNPFYRIPWL
jgi:hypothetical protein